MRTPSGDLHVVDFKTNQIVSDIQPKDYWDDKRHWEIKNNIDTLEFRVFENTDHAATLVQQNLVLKEVRGGRIVPYVITETEKDSKDRSLMVYASGEWIQLAKAGIIEPQKLESKTLKQCMEIALKGTKWTIGKTEHDGAHSMVIEAFTDPLDLLKKIAASFELELQYRAEVLGSKIVGRYVDMVQKRGRDTRKEVIFGKDLIGIKRIENSQSICTALLGFVKKENGEFITISSINKGVPYLVDDAAYQRWNENGKHKFAFYTPQTDDQNMSPERLLTLMKTEMGKLVNASVSYGVDVQNIARIPNFSHEEINEGDTIRIIDEGFTPKLYLEARAIAGDESFKDPTQDNYVFGDYREIVDQNDELRRLYQKILSSLYDKVPQELFDQLNNKVKEQNKDIIDAKDKANQAQKESQTAKDLAEATQKYMDQNLVDIIEGVNPPTANLKSNKTLWRDISNGKPGILKIWTGVVWEPVVPDTAPLQQSIKDVKKDIETAKTELNQKVQSMEGKAQEIAGQIVDVQKQVNGKVDQTWINTQLKDKADKSGVFTKEEIKDGFIGKQIYETDKQGNVQKFKDIKTSIGQTNEALTQKADLKKTNEGLSQLETKTNEIKTTAEGTKQQLSQLETTVKNTEISIRNLVPNSAIKQTSSDYGFGFRITTIDLVAGETYILMGNGRVDQQTLDDGKYLVIYIYEPTWKYVSKNFTIKTLTDSTGYTLFTPTWTGKYTVASYLSPTGENRLGKVTTNWVALYKGNVPMGWSPAPEDQVTTTDFTKKTVEIETTIKGINTTVSNVQNEQGKLTECVTKSEQTADGFKISIESLTKKDTEISNKLNTVEQTVEGTKKTISDVQQTTSELKKTTTEIKEEAGKVTEKLSSVEKKFDDMKFSGRNLLLSTSGTLKSDTGTTISNTDLKSFKFAPDTFEMIRGQEVTLSITARTQAFSKGTPSPWIGMELSVTYEDNEQVWLPIRIEDKVAISQGWVRYSAVVTIKNKAIKTGYLNSLIRNVEGMVELKEWQIEIGNKATEYRPAVEDQVTTDEFTKKTTEIEKSLDGVKTTVSTVQKDQGTMQTTLNQVKQTTDSNAQTITTLSQTQGKQGEIIQQNTSDITQLNNQIKSKVSETQMQEYVGGLGSTNLLFNAAFEDRIITPSSGIATSRTPSLSKWKVVATVSGSAVTPTTARQHDGYNSAQIQATGLTVNGLTGISQILPVTSSSGKLVLSAWVFTYNKDGLDQGGALEIKFLNGSTTVTTSSVDLKDQLNKGVWTFVSVTAEVPSNAVTHVEAYIWIRRNGLIWVSQPQFQQGAIPSAFMENPKDYANYDQLVGAIAKKVSTSDFNSKVSTFETSINQQSKSIELRAEKKEVYTKAEANGQFGSKALVDSHTSQLSVMSNELNSTVKKGNIISSINQTAEQIQVQANKINLVGYVTAEHLKGDVLEGMNIRTSRQSNDPRWVEIMKSNVRLKEDGLVRSYWGFYTRNDGGVQPSLFLGKDSTDTVGSIAITQVTPNKTDFANAWGTIGMVNEISNNMFKTNATVGFFRDSGGRLELSAGGHVLIDSKGLINVRSDDFLLLRAKRTMRLETTWDNGGTNINMEATKSFNVMAHSQIWLASNEEHFYDNNAGKFYFRNRNKPSDQNSVLIDDDNANADIRLAYIRVRASHVSGYQNSLQVKNYNGTEFRDLECRSLTVNGNFYNKSTKNIKANIRDLPFDPVEKIMALQPRSYNLKTEVEKLYKMREGKEEGEEPFTTKDIVANCGFIAEETDEIFKSQDGKAVNIYGTLAIHIAATQKMHIELKEVKEENKQLKEQVSMLINEVSTLKDLVRKLIDEKPEQP
ncbi:phage tail spike protein [Bacillus cereus group sp. TH152-1LC]|uniref:phage tail spike protein n=1 Tax=Bacillus cereus group sp. TH152-1LC TaxID=3018060 RepID=UPI0022E5CBCA|nr:phage tail spike protein [Bacillus cereus group sp. TH152-1LC]MDA1680973.1 tail fiber domain-containing protein [Bacillus cereus group sp. TH152-1LC]